MPEPDETDLLMVQVPPVVRGAPKASMWDQESNSVVQVKKKGAPEVSTGHGGSCVAVILREWGRPRAHTHEGVPLACWALRMYSVGTVVKVDEMPSQGSLSDHMHASDCA